MRVERGRKLVASEFRRAARAEGTVAAAGVGGSGSKMPPACRPFQPLPATDTADDVVVSVSSIGSGGTGTHGTHGSTGSFSRLVEPMPPKMALNPLHFEDEEDEEDDDDVEHFDFALAIDDDDDDGAAGGDGGVGVGTGWSAADSAAMHRISLSMGGVARHGGGDGSEDDEGCMEVTGRYG